MSDGHCKECVYRHNAGHKKGSRLASKYNDWCANYSKQAARAVGHCKRFDGKKVQVMSESSVSPCVNACELGAKGYCVGCFRSLDEIAAWKGAGGLERTQIIASAIIRELEAVP